MKLNIGKRRGMKIRGKTPYEACDNCVWWINSGKLTKEEFWEQYKEKYPEQYDAILKILKWIHENPHSEEKYKGMMLIDEMIEWQPPDGKCPFNHKPDLSNKERKEYKLTCFKCKAELICPANVYRENGRPLCGECYGDSLHDDRYDDFDEDAAYEQALYRKYGEI